MQEQDLGYRAFQPIIISQSKIRGKKPTIDVEIPGDLNPYGEEKVRLHGCR